MAELASSAHGPLHRGKALNMPPGEFILAIRLQLRSYVEFVAFALVMLLSLGAGTVLARAAMGVLLYKMMQRRNSSVGNR